MVTENAKKREERWVLRRALIQYCAANGLTRAALARRLDAPYPTVASWWTVRSKSGRKTNTFSEKWAQRVREVFPELASGYFNSTKTTISRESLEVRRQELPAELKVKICALVSRTIDQLNLIETLIPGRRCDLLAQKSPWGAAEEFRAFLGIGPSGAVHSVEIALEQLGVPVVRLQGRGDEESGVATLVTDPRPVIVIVGDAFAGTERERFEITAELGFAVVAQSLRAAAKRNAVNKFADEFLAPEAGIRRWILPNQKTYSKSDILSISAAFSVPPDSIERQFRRMDLYRAASWEESGSENQRSGFLASLATKLQVDS